LDCDGHFVRLAATSATVFMVLEGALFVLGLLMTFQGYRREAA